MLGKMVIISMNGGWTYPGVNYILMRVVTEVTTIDDCSNSKSDQIVFGVMTVKIPENNPVRISFTSFQRYICNELLIMYFYIS